MMKGVGKIKANFCVSIPSRVATRASVVFSEPLHGGSSEEWVTGLAEVRDRFQGGKGPALPTGRHRVSPKTTLARPPVILPPLTDTIFMR